MTEMEPVRQDAEEPANGGAEASAEDSAVAPSPPGFGRVLAQAREQQGISLADIAARLRLHPRQISALEEERLESLPEAPFVRGFVRNYAKELRLDPVPLLAQLGEKLPAASSAVASMAGTGITAAEVRRAGMDRTSRIAVVGGAVAVLFALGLIGWIASIRAPVSDASKAPVAPTVQPSAPATPAAGTASEEPTASAPSDSAAAAASSDAAASAAPVAASAPVKPPAAVPSGGLRLVVGERPSWVEITQADGRVVLSGLQEAGTERRLGNLQPPLRLVIGNASSVSLEFRGKSIDLNAHVRANDLARLSLE